MSKLPVLTLLVLATFAGPAGAAEAMGGTFGGGFVDGFLSLVKLLASPLFDVTLVAENFGTGGYTIGYYLGVLTFAGFAGAVASSEKGDAGGVRLEAGNSSRGRGPLRTSSAE